ncbi:MAG TPA: glycosyltransferase family 39 protein [Coleofasciculaceae cyanobacterium]
MIQLARIQNRLVVGAKWLFVFFVAALFLWGIALGNVPLRDWDEATRALVAREIYRTGNWLYPTLQGQPYLLKPPLMDWLIALSYKIGGVGEFTTRLPGAVLTACGVPLLYLLARELFREQLPAIFSAGVYLTLLPVVRHGRLAMLDGMAVSFFLLSLLCLLKSYLDRRWALGVGFGLGLIAFTKGLLMIPLGAIAVIFLLITRQFLILRNAYFWLGIILGNLPVVAWYIAQWQHYGTTFLQVHFQGQGLERISEGVEGNSAPAWYYLLELLKYTWPWLLFWPGGLYLAWKKRRTHWGILILLGTVGYLGIISLMRTKLPWYIMPLYPFFTLAVAVQLSQLWQKNNKYPQILAWLLGFIAVAAVGGCTYFIVADPQPVLIIMALVVMLMMGLAAWQVKQNNRTFIPILLLGMYLTLGLLMASTSWLWELNEAFPVKPVAALIRQKTELGAIVYTSFGYRRPSLDFYSDRRVVPADRVKLQQLWSTRPYLLLDGSTLEILNLPGSVSLGMAEGFTLVAPRTKATQLTQHHLDTSQLSLSLSTFIDDVFS